MSLTAAIHLSVTGTEVSALDLGSASLPFALALALDFTNGSGASQASKVWTDTRTLAASATEDLDLAAVLIDGTTGAAITFATIKGVIITALAANTNDVQVTRPASNGVPLFIAAGDGRAIKPGGFDAWGCPGTGVTVTASTGDLLTVTNSGGTTGVTYSIVIIGT